MALTLEERIAELEPKIPELGEERFWALVEGLRWGDSVANPQPKAEALAGQAQLGEVIAAQRRYRQLDAKLERAISAWELRAQERVGLDAGLQRELRGHFIGLGRESYEGVLKTPYRAQVRADHDDYLEGFAKVFALALARYPEADWVALG